jgi:hypothetical protein
MRRPDSCTPTEHRFHLLLKALAAQCALLLEIGTDLGDLEL